MEDLGSIPFEVALDLDLLEAFLSGRLAGERVRLAPDLENRRTRVSAEVRLAECRYPVGVLALLRRLVEPMRSAAALTVVRQERDEVELQLRFSLLPAKPGAAPIALTTESDYVHIQMGMAGEIEIFGRGDDRAGETVEGWVQAYVRAVIEGGFRETYWQPDDGSAVVRSKTWLLVGGKWRRTGAIGVRSVGRRVERHYEPYV
jgi:hypothetical protein